MVHEEVEITLGWRPAECGMNHTKKLSAFHAKVKAAFDTAKHPEERIPLDMFPENLSSHLEIP